MLDIDQSKMIRAANEIKRYLKDHPNAADTLDGIKKSWLLRQRIEEPVLRVQMVLDYLVSESQVERKTSLSGDQVYFSAKRSRKGEN